MTEIDQFKQDIIDLFSHKRGGHLQRWVYSDRDRGAEESGSMLWHAFLRANRNYYVLPHEIALIGDSIPKIARGSRLEKFDTVVDFGVGDETAVKNKAMITIKSCRNVEIYAPVDCSGDFLKRATEVVKETYPTLHISPYNQDFFKDRFELPGKNRLSVLFGLTASNQNMMEGKNFPRDTIVEKLAHLAMLTGNDNEMLVTFDANPDPESAMAAYDHITWERLVTGVMYDVQALLQPTGNFKPSAWYHQPVWNEEGHVIHQCIVASEDQSFEIDGQSFDVRRGDRFVIKNNFKFPVDLFQDMVREAGYRVNEIYRGHQNRIMLQHLTVDRTA